MKWLALAAALGALSAPAPDVAPRAAWGVDGPVSAIVPGPHGTLFVAGEFDRVAPITGHGVALDAATGGVRAGWPQFDRTVQAAAPDGAGGYYLGGYFARVAGASRPGLVHLRADGSVDATFRPVLAEEGGTAVVNAIATGGGMVYVSGDFILPGDKGADVIGLDAATGALRWTATVDGEVQALALAHGTLFAGGALLAAFDPATGVARAVVPAADGVISALAVVDDTVYVGGAFTVFGGRSRNRLAAFSAADGAVTAWDPVADGEVTVLAAAGAMIYAGGDFTSIGALARAHAAAIDATSGLPAAWDPQPDGEVLTLAAAGTTVFLGGGFTHLGATARAGLASVDANTGTAHAWDPDPHARVMALATDGTTVFAGGDFDTLGGTSRAGLAQLDARSGAVTAWEPSTRVAAIGALAVAGGRLYVGGRSLAAYDARTGAAIAWHARGPGKVSALAVRGRTVYAAGRRLAAFDARTGAARPFATRLHLPPGGRLVAGPRGVYVSDPPRAFDDGGRPLRGWRPAPEPDGSLQALAMGSGVVFAGGGFQRLGGRRREALAALDPVTGRARPWHAAAGHFIDALTVGRGAVFAAGVELHAFDARSGRTLAWRPAVDGNRASQLAVSGDSLYYLVAEQIQPLQVDVNERTVFAFPAPQAR